MKPIVDGLINEYEGKVDIVYVDVDDPNNQELTAAFRINAVPTFAFVNSDGSVKELFVGGMYENVLKQKIDSLQ